MMKTKPVATTLLVVMAIIFLISYPQRHDTFWAFIMHISGAAMIGGLADWYAVTALFTKPLGIPFKTAILPRSKERLIQIGRTMLSEELLRVPQMYYAIKKERVMVRIVEYGMSDVGQVQIRNLLYGVGNQVLSHMDIEPMRQEINKAIYKGVTNWKATPLVILFGRCMLERHTASVFWLYFNRTCQRVIASNQVYPYLYRVMLETVQKKAVQFLKENESIDSALGRYVWGQAIRFFNNLETNTEWQAFIEEHKNQWIRMVLEEWEGKLIDGDTLDWKRLMDIVMERFNVLGTEILLNPDKQAPFERFFLLRSIPWLQKLNPLIDSVVGQELSRYSPDEITQIVRGKMYYDLQMVRINGSLIGAVLGGILYGLTIIVEGVLK